jgi:predicted GIY-YIG superfamily endonuclease
MDGGGNADMISIMAAWTYTLRCGDGTYYVGCTTNIDQRLGEHIAGTHGGYTASRRPVEMIWAAEFPTIDDAISVERQLKGWSRVKKEALVQGDFEDLPGLSRSRFKRLGGSCPT